MQQLLRKEQKLSVYLEMVWTFVSCVENVVQVRLPGQADGVTQQRVHWSASLPHCEGVNGLIVAFFAGLACSLWVCVGSFHSPPTV